MAQGEERQGGGWLPPLEARALGEGSPARVERGKLSPVTIAVIVAGAAVVALLLLGWAISLAEGARRDPLEGAVHEFLEARAAGDAARACDQLTERARRDMVALLRGVDQPAASAADCERYVLQTSESSEFTDPALPSFRDRELSVRHFPGPEGGDYATVRPSGLSDPFLELRKVRGEWKLDGLAAERVSFIAGCVDKGAPRAYCGCLYDGLAEAGHGSTPELAEVFRGFAQGAAPPPVLRDAIAACSADAPRA